LKNIFSFRNPAFLPLLVSIICFLSRACILAIKPYELASIDVIRFDTVIMELRAGRNPYSTTNYVNYAPFWLQILYFLDTIASKFHMQLRTVVMLFLACIESVVIILCFFIIREFKSEAKQTSIISRSSPQAQDTAIAILLFCAFVINPIPISQICVQGHFDVLVALFISTALLFLTRWHREYIPVYWYGASTALGLGILTKTVPLLLTPLLFFNIKKLKKLEILFGIYLLFFPAALGISIIYILDPHSTLTKVIGYRSMAEYFGISGILALLNLPGLLKVYTTLSPLLMILFLFSAIAKTASKKLLSFHDLLGLCLVLIMFPIVWGAGFGLQYIYWFYPILIILLGIAGTRERLLLFFCLFITTATYTVEYLLFQGGGYLVSVWQSNLVSGAASLLNTKSGMTFLRLPMFLSFITMWIYYFIKISRSERHVL
jgi:hypothetical protein